MLHPNLRRVPDSVCDFHLAAGGSGVTVRLPELVVSVDVFGIGHIPIAMPEEWESYLAKAKECLRSARSACGMGLNNCAAKRSYYAAYLAELAAVKGNYRRNFHGKGSQDATRASAQTREWKSASKFTALIKFGKIKKMADIDQAVSHNLKLTKCKTVTLCLFSWGLFS
jgi:hypothetical protein